MNSKTSKSYFRKIVGDLEKAAKIPLEGRKEPGFADLKIFEYWTRILRVNPESINKEAALKLMSPDHLHAACDEVGAYFSKISQPAPDTIGEGEECSLRFLRMVRRYVREASPSTWKRAVANLTPHLVRVSEENMAPIHYQHLLDVIRTHFLESAMDFLKAGVKGDDVAFRRMDMFKEKYRLNDDEMELLLYLWLRKNPDMSTDDEERSMFRSHRMRDICNNASLRNISRATGFSEEYISELLGRDGALMRMALVSRDLDVPKDVVFFLSGRSNEGRLNPYQKAADPMVPFKQLQKGNPDAKFVLEMIRNHDGKNPLHILFYGMEGTGKTELAKAIAKELDRPLWAVDIDLEDDVCASSAMERNTVLEQFRLRGIRLADWQCEKDGGIILVDEADLILNDSEKGCLNSFFETIKAPVIWISNSMRRVENSTRRRFNYSMAFKGLAKDERLSVLNSVLKVQGAENLLTEEEKLKLVVEYPAMAGGLSLAVQQTQTLGAGYKTMARILKAHTQLMGIKNGSLKDVESHAPNYSLEGLNIEGSMDEVLDVVKNYDEVWKTLDEDSAPNSLNILLYGPPGTGKTEFVRHLARTLGRNLVIKRASDLLGMFVGQTEALIAAAFEEAERTGSILFFDEADSFLTNRSSAVRSFEVSKVNELLTQMENFKGIFIAATNFEGMLDPACRRRFALKLGFDYLKPDGVRHIWDVFFPETACPDTAANLPMITPGDFNAVYGRMRYLPKSSITPERIEAELRKELQSKDARAGRVMGF